jgi:renalase
MKGAAARIAVIGAGFAGSVCARLLADAGLTVRVFDKSRGVGGRLATRRAEWGTAQAARQVVRFDHGAPGFCARTPDFVRFVAQAARQGWLKRWVPRLAPGGAPELDAAWWLPSPDMPALCRALLVDLPVQTGCAVAAIGPGPAGWRLELAGVGLAESFDAIVLAIPPAQAAELLAPQHPVWAARLAALPMTPAWVLMASTDEDSAMPAWDVAWSPVGPLAWIIRQDTKPGRERRPGQAHWVVHAQESWSRAHLECTADVVTPALQAALANCLGGDRVWHHVAVHRWRYAAVSDCLPPQAAPLLAERCGWDATLGIGICGDALGGGGVEGAWHSARALAVRVLGAIGAGQSWRDRATVPSDYA